MSFRILSPFWTVLSAWLLFGCNATDFGQSAVACKEGCAEVYRTCLQNLFLYEAAPDRSKTQASREVNQMLLWGSCALDQKSCQQSCSGE